MTDKKLITIEDQPRPVGHWLIVKNYQVFFFFFCLDILPLRVYRTLHRKLDSGSLNSVRDGAATENYRNLKNMRQDCEYSMELIPKYIVPGKLSAVFFF